MKIHVVISHGMCLSYFLFILILPIILGVESYLAAAGGGVPCGDRGGGDVHGTASSR
jgi:hypothetical protein